MDATDLLALQFNDIGHIIDALAEELDVDTSRSRAFPGANLIGFTFWHIARTIDWAVNTMVRATPEVAFGFDFKGPADARINQIGFGIPLDEADAIAAATTPAEVAAYYASVLAEAVTWLRTGPDLSVVPDSMKHQPEFPGYANELYLEEVRSYKPAGQTALDILSGPGVGHVRGHFGEIDLVRQMLG